MALDKFRRGILQHQTIKENVRDEDGSVAVEQEEREWRSFVLNRFRPEDDVVTRDLLRIMQGRRSSTLSAQFASSSASMSTGRGRRRKRRNSLKEVVGHSDDIETLSLGFARPQHAPRSRRARRIDPTTMDMIATILGRLVASCPEGGRLIHTDNLADASMMVQVLDHLHGSHRRGRPMGHPTDASNESEDENGNASRAYGGYFDPESEEEDDDAEDGAAAHDEDDEEDVVIDTEEDLSSDGPVYNYEESASSAQE